jgi:hypothetical protein
MVGGAGSVTGISGVYDPKQAAIGVGYGPYTIGDMPSYNGDPGLHYDRNYQIFKDYNRSRDYKYDDYIHGDGIDADVLKQINDYIKKSKQVPTPTPAVNTVTVAPEPVVRKKMTKSKDVGDALSELINDHS